MHSYICITLLFPYLRCHPKPQSPFAADCHSRLGLKAGYRPENYNCKRQHRPLQDHPDILEPAISYRPDWQQIYRHHGRGHQAKHRQYHNYFRHARQIVSEK